MNRERRALGALLVLLAGLTLSPAARAVPSVLRASTRPMFASFHLGPAIEITGDWGSQLKIGQEFGYHFSGRFEGPALGLSVEESFTNCTPVSDVSCVSFEVGPKFWWDFALVPGMGIYLAPMVRLGFTHVHISATVFGQDYDGAANAFGIQLGLALRLVLGDRGLVYFRPITMDMAIGGADDDLERVYDENFAMRWDLVFGGGFVF
jgi:hypothetical protein